MDNKLTGTICNVTDKACQSVDLPLSELSVSFSYGNIDFSVSAEYWAFAFSSVLGLWLFSHCVGLVINFLRSA